MLFGLFFGAGNLIFPVYLGQQAGSHLFPAITGFLLTGVCLPLLAVVALGITGSHGLLPFASRFGRKFGIVFTCALYLTIGPLFACPRCITVPYETGIHALMPAGMSQRIGLFLFSLICYVLILILSLHPGKILDYVGKFLNPAFILFLAVIIFTALTHPHGTSFPPAKAYATGAFTTGFLNGYNTMDALAGLAFGIVIVNVLKDLGIRDEKAAAVDTMKTGALSCCFMGLIYVLTAIMGMESRGYAPMRKNGGLILADIAAFYFPHGGAFLLAAIVFLACIKTAIGLVTSCSSTFQELTSGKVPYRVWAVIFSTATFAIANIGLSAIIQISVPVLSMLYPISIVMIGTGILDSRLHFSRRSRGLIITVVCISSVFDLLRTLPAAWTAAAHLDGLLAFLGHYLPFFQAGFGWLVPTVIAMATVVLHLYFSVRTIKE